MWSYGYGCGYQSIRHRSKKGITTLGKKEYTIDETNNLMFTKLKRNSSTTGIKVMYLPQPFFGSPFIPKGHTQFGVPVAKIISQIVLVALHWIRSHGSTL